MSRLNLSAMASADAGANGAPAPTCGACGHWAEIDRDPNNISKRRGECRYGPIAVTLLPGAQPGQVVRLTGYPRPGPEENACAQYAAKIAVET